MISPGIIFFLFKKELKQETRQKYALNGILLYVASTVFICMLSFKSLIHPATWNALLWIILIFAAINTVSKSFSQEQNERHLFVYTLIGPAELIISKVFYNAFLLSIVGLITYGFYGLFIGNIVKYPLLFLVILITGCITFATILTFIAAIASKTSNNSGLMAILGIPLLTPALLTIIKASKNTIDGLDGSLVIDELMILILLNLISISLSYLLFPYLWRD